MKFGRSITPGWSRLAIAVVLACASIGQADDVAAQEVEATLAEAIEVYAEALDTEDREERLERFRRAERLFATVATVAAPTSDLHANLGNAALQAEHLGAAVLAYRRALLLDPDHDRASQNLEHVRGLTPDWVPRPETQSVFGSFFDWHRTMSPSERKLLAALAFALAALLLAAGIASNSVAARNASLLPGLVWIVLLASMVADPSAAAQEQGVVVGRELIVRAADSVHSPARFSRPLPIGAEVDILEARETWLRVALANGREGWVRASGVERVGP
ncbi:MAG: hypothetical protein QF570_01055 [Myxococcota bacterium]|nr:hypothetical protein [Myxococcota bacterium]